MSSKVKQSLIPLSNNINPDKSHKSPCLNNPHLVDKDKKLVAILTIKESEKKQAVMKEKKKRKK